jgi:hypothetical protein
MRRIRGIAPGNPRKKKNRLRGIKYVSGKKCSFRRADLEKFNAVFRSGLAGTALSADV